jgi:hypothetical protein
MRADSIPLRFSLWLLAGVLFVALCAAVANSAEPPVASVLVARNAAIDKSLASMGASIYAGDHLIVSANGALRLRIGQGQLYMLSLTDTKIVQDRDLVDAQLYSGTAGFSATSKDPLEVETAVGMLRPASEARSFGQATVIGVNRVLITSYEGDLVLTRNGESRTIEAGKSYTVAVPLAADPEPQTPQQGPPSAHRNNGQWIFTAVVVGGAAAAGFGIWEAMSESSSKPN